MSRQLPNANAKRKLAMVNSLDPDLARWCAALATTQSADQVPPGYLRLDEIAKLLGKSESHTFRLLTIATREGRCETASYRVQRGQRVIPLRHYKLK